MRDFHQVSESIASPWLKKFIDFQRSEIFPNPSLKNANIQFPVFSSMDLWDTGIYPVYFPKKAFFQYIFQYLRLFKYFQYIFLIILYFSDHSF